MRQAGALALTGMLVAFYIVLLVIGERAGKDDRRHATLLVVGSHTNSRAGNVSDVRANAVIDAEDDSASATWNFYSYQIGTLVQHARFCSMDVALVGVGLTSAAADGSADVLVNGETIERITFSEERRALFPLAPGRLVPTNQIPQLIELVPLDREYGFLIPIPQRFCSSNALEVGVRLHHASWTIADAGVKLVYQPAPFTGMRAAIVAALGLLIAVCGVIALHALIVRMFALGVMPLLAAVAVLIVSPLTFDQWDYRLWTSFGEVAIFGAGDPARLWLGSPLWTFVPPLFSTVTAAVFVLTDHGGIAATASFMKIGMGIAYCYTAYRIALRAPAELRASWALIALLLPVGLYEVAAGYRELFAVALAIASLTATMRRKLAYGTVLAVLASSIGEELVPLVLFPAAVALTLPLPSAQRVGRAAGLAAIAAFLLCSEWIFLIPRETAAAAVSYRFGDAPLGGASWAGALSGLGLLPSWLPATSPILGALLFAALAALPVWRLIQTIRSASTSRENSDLDLAGVFIALVGALLVAFRGTDPNLWYSLAALSLWYFASAYPTNPFPLLLGTIEGLAFYSTVGFREFVNHAYFWPVDEGLLGTLSSLRYVFYLMVDALTIALIIAICRKDARKLFSRASPFVSLLFLCAVFSRSTASLILDVVIVLAVAALVAGVLRAYTRLSSERENKNAFYRSGSVVTMAAIGAYGGLREALAGLCASALCVYATQYELSVYDLILGAGGIAALGVQTGSGVIANIASAALVIVMLVATISIFQSRTAQRPKSTL